MKLFVFIMGLLFGSFFNVIILRVPRKESIIWPRSHCPHCQTTLKWYELIPVLSFIFLKGKCRYCGYRISWQYPLVEVMTGLIYLLLYYHFGLTMVFLIYIILISLLIISSVIDIREKIIPNVITFPGMVTGLISSIILKHIGFWNSLLGILIPGIFLFIIALIFKGGLGMGDVKLVAMIGAFTGVRWALMALFTGAFLGAITGIILIVSGVLDRKKPVPFGPFISIGGLVSILWGYEIWIYIINLY
ncbi:prepilin peptidase [Halothermothrix orenii]|uniref:Prepilin peptidase n=1 Tax=Halothermothrix orenii (strain H 168 / OCM 544 / DSM 9562) TaxID=373903 RepID=B8D2D1_HALOH|nr:A24 family peptidase [Halothermothrix orenii]ACL69358.1 Prepilin peptidase [Halothermothrix orenii H 168]